VKLSSNLIRFEKEIISKLDEFEGKLSFDNVLSWIFQFKDEDQSLAVKLFLRLKYFTAKEVQDLCRVLYSQLPDSIHKNLYKTLFVSLGGSSDSGEMLLYHYREQNNIPQSNCKNIDAFREIIESRQMLPYNYLIFVDDFIGTGGQATTILTEELKEIISFHKFDYVGFQAIVGFMDGKKLIEENTNIEVIVSHELTEKDRIFNEASEILTKDFFVRQRLREIIQKYGERLYRIGPLGYGGNQALIAFFHNTPNNTLPVIWASSATEGWRALLPRGESKSLYKTDRSAKLVLIYLGVLGGRSILKELNYFFSEECFDPESTIKNLKINHFIMVKANDHGNLIELTTKGIREVQLLYETENKLSVAILVKLSSIFSANIEKYPKCSSNMIHYLKEHKSKLISLIKTACKLGEVSTIIGLKRTISWFLSKEFDYEERIQLGELILNSFDKKILGEQFSYTKVDDLGSSNVALGNYERALENIEEGISNFSDLKDYYGLSLSWRHIQNIRYHQKNYYDAAFGLRIVFGASCAIEDQLSRHEMQTEILHHMTKIADTLNQNVWMTDLRKRSDALFNLDYDESYQTDIKLGPQSPHLNTDQIRNNTPPDYYLFLVRHPEAIKNIKNEFGRHMLNLLTPDGEKQKKAMSCMLSKIIPCGNEDNSTIFSGTSVVTSSLAEEIAFNLNRKVIYDNSLDSINSGDLTGYNEDDAAVMFPDLLNKIKSYRKLELDGYAINFPQGESVRDLTIRLSKFLLERVYTDRGPQYCVLVGHNSSITAILNIISAVDRWPVDSSYLYKEVPFGKIIKITFKQFDSQINIEYI
jgi:broad specificity phosphatase PhoE